MEETSFNWPWSRMQLTSSFRDDYDNVAGYYAGKKHIFFNPYNIDFEKWAKERPNYKEAEAEE